MSGEVVINLVENGEEYDQKVELSLGIQEGNYSLAFMVSPLEKIEDLLYSSLHYDALKEHFLSSMDPDDWEYQNIYRYACSHSLLELYENASSVFSMVKWKKLEIIF